MRIAWLSVPIVFTASIAWSATIELQAMKDNTIYRDVANSNGAGNGIFAGSTANTNENRRGLIAFDLTSLPSDAVVQSVSLTLFLGQAQSTATDVSLHRLTASWGEGTSVASGGGGAGAPATSGDATWERRFFDTVSWTTPGGDFASGVSATLSVGAEGSSYTWTSATMANDVQLWIDSPLTNNGWIIIGDESRNRTAKRFDSRESATLANRPTLSITYVPEPSMAAALVALATLAKRRRR